MNSPNPSDLPGQARIRPQKNAPKRPKLLIWVSLLLAALFLFLAVRHISWPEVLVTFAQIRWQYILLAFLTNTLALFLRGLRWDVLVSARKWLNPLHTFFASAIGYMGNTFLPARAGEVLRAVILGQMVEISSSYIFATAITERVIDLVALVLTGAISITSASTALPVWLLTAVRWMALAGLLGLTLFILAPRLENLILKTMNLIPFPQTWKDKLRELVIQFLDGARAFLHPSRMVSFIAITALVWLTDGFGTVLFASGMGLRLTLGQSLLFLAALGLSSALPSTPGYVGIYQFVAVSVLPLFGLTPSQALSYILAAQFINIITIVIWGLTGLLKFGRGKPKPAS